MNNIYIEAVVCAALIPGSMVILYGVLNSASKSVVTPHSANPDATQKIREAHYAACAAKEAKAIADFVALPATERNSRRGNEFLIFTPILLLAMFFFWPTVAFFCLPLTLGFIVAACGATWAPSGAPSEKEIFRAEVLRRLK